MLLEVKDLSFTYPGQKKKALAGIDLSIGEGEFVVLCGMSGCGKSTLLKQFKTVLAPSGTASGEIRFQGKHLSETDERTQAKEIGFLSQSPENQIVTDKVWHELAFGLESLGEQTPVIRKKVAEMSSFFGIEKWFHQDVSELSGGQKQLLSLAAVMVMGPKFLILDEPTSQLDPIAASDFIEVLSRVNREFGTTILITEHRLEDVFAAADRVLVMEEGRIVSDGTPAETGRNLVSSGRKIFASLPAPMRIFAAVEKEDVDFPVSVSEGKKWLSGFASRHELKRLPQEVIGETSPETVVSMKDVWFRYEKDQPDVVKGMDLTLHKGEFFAILGGNGTGKTTALKLIAGTRKPVRGKVMRSGRTALLPQDPQTLFSRDTVREELQAVSSDEEKIREMVSVCRLSHLLERHPYDLSGGEQQRTALAKILLTGPDILLLDEPTKGIDADFKYVLAKILYELMAKGVSVLMVSHDVEFSARYAQTCALFFDGEIVSKGTPRNFFKDSSFYTTAASRMARDLIPDAVTAEDVIYALGTDVYTPDKEPCFPGEKGDSSKKDDIMAESEESESEEDDGFPLFAGKRPKARELVLLAVLCAVGIVSRLMFAMLPEFKPVFSIVIVTGIALGAKTGFLVGALTMLLSNMFFGQGPWTPWQMLALGLIGLLSGICFTKDRLKRDKVTMAVFGAVTAVCVFGGIMNPASAVMWQKSAVNGKMILAYFVSGLPFDLANAAATFLFLYLGGEPLLKKLVRVRKKYLRYAS